MAKKDIRTYQYGLKMKLLVVEPKLTINGLFRKILEEREVPQD